MERVTGSLTNKLRWSGPRWCRPLYRGFNQTQHWQKKKKRPSVDSDMTTGIGWVSKKGKWGMMHLRVWEKLSLQELLGLNATLHTHLKGGRLCLQKNLLIQAAYYELIRGFLTAGRENNLICSSRKGLLHLYQGYDLCSEESLHREPNLKSVSHSQLNPEATCNPRLREPYSLVIKRRLKVSDQINVQKLLRASAASLLKAAF